MAIVINGSGTVTGLAVGGLPDGTVDAGTLATNSVDSAELIDGAVDDSHMAAMAASKLTGALPAISGASLTGITTGKVLQVVESTLGTSVDKSTGGGRTDIISGTITPSATTSKIWVMVQLTYYKQGTGSSNSGYQINRRISGLSDVSIDSQYWHYADTPDTNWMLHYPVQKIDSPSSTAAVTYVFDVTNSGSNTMSFLLNGTKIILLEIGA